MILEVGGVRLTSSVQVNVAFWNRFEESRCMLTEFLNISWASVLFSLLNFGILAHIFSRSAKDTI